MNNNQSSNIQIRKEVTDFLELQIYGERTNACLARFTVVKLSDNAKEILKVIENAIYFGDQTHAIDDINVVETQRILSILMMNVSLVEQNLVHYISLIIANNQDQSKFDVFERSYNRMLSKSTQQLQRQSDNVLTIDQCKQWQRDIGFIKTANQKDYIATDSRCEINETN